jgi:hypothetical protein
MNPRRSLPLALLLALTLSPSALLAGQPELGTVVASGPDYLVVTTGSHGRRLFVLEAPLAAGIQPGVEVAVTFRVGEDAELHATNVQPAAASLRSGQAEPTTGKLLSALGSVALLSSAGPVMALLALAG